MFSNDNELKKYLYLISYAGIILAIILNLSSVFSFIQYLWQLIIPFIVGFCIAFIFIKPSNCIFFLIYTIFFMHISAFDNSTGLTKKFCKAR